MTEKDRPDEKEGSGIKVVDRRLFTADGELREGDHDAEDQETTAGEPAQEEPAPASEEETEEAHGFEHQPVEEPEGVDFTMLINAMAQPALYYLGEMPSPDGSQPKVDLDHAKLQIDMLQVLKVKSRGNLSNEESALIDQVLYQLRMLFVSKSSGKQDA